MLPFQPNVENIFHARLPVDSSNFFSTSESDSASVPSASGLPWQAPSLRMCFVSIVKQGGGGAASSSSDSGRSIGKGVTSKLKLESKNENNLCLSQVNGCDLDSTRLKMRADRAAGTEKSAVRLSTCAGTCRPQSRFSPSTILGHFRPPIRCSILRWNKVTFPLENSGYIMELGIGDQRG